MQAFQCDLRWPAAIVLRTQPQQQLTYLSARKNTVLCYFLTQHFHCNLQSLPGLQTYSWSRLKQPSQCDLHTWIVFYDGGRARAPVVQTRFPPSTPGATLGEKTQGFMRFQTSKHHLAAATPLQSAITALQITLYRTTSARAANILRKQPLQCDLRTWTVLYQPRISHKRGFFPSTPGSTLCEKTQDFMRFLISKHHLDAAIPLQSATIVL